MGYPYRTTLSYSYTGFQQSQGDNSFPGTQVDNDLVNLKRSADEIIDFLQVSFGSEGRLAPQSVGLDALAFEIRERLTDEVIADVDAIASNIDLTPINGLSATDLQAAVAELYSGKAASDHIHNASAVPISAISGLVATTVQAALAELRTFAPRTGDAVLTIDDTAPTGWIMMNDGTIGSASSGATTRANADCENLYKLLWAKVTNDWAPVTGGRGDSANADWTANKPIALTKQLGRVLGIAGAGSGLTSRALGSYLGAETHALTEAEGPVHDHAASDAGHTHGKPTNTDGFFAYDTTSAIAAFSTGGASYQFTSPTETGSGNADITVENAGSGDPHNNMQPTAFWNIRIKL